jgi:hypothetical protein
MALHRFETAVIVSEPIHLPRVMPKAQHDDLRATTSAGESAYEGASRLRMILLEGYCSTQYLLRRDLLFRKRPDLAKARQRSKRLDH